MCILLWKRTVMHHVSTVRVLIIVAGMLALTTSCLKDWCLFGCAHCEIEYGDCQCKPNPDYGCPPGTVHGEYNYGGWFKPQCSCICEPGWTGPRCDRWDTSYHISFRHGWDTTALSPEIRTDSVASYWGVFPSGSALDTVRIIGLPLQEGGEGTYPLCGWDCLYMEVSFQGQEAKSVTGTLILSDVRAEYFQWYWEGTFNSNLYVEGTGQIYYVREGVFKLRSYYP